MLAQCSLVMLAVNALLFFTTLFFDAKGRLVSTRIGELSTATLTERLQALAQ